MIEITGIAKVVLEIVDNSTLHGLVIPIPNPENPDEMNYKEIIALDGSQGVVLIELTEQRQQKFGAALLIHVELASEPQTQPSQMDLTTFPVNIYVGPNNLWVYRLDFTGQDAIGRIIIS